MYSWTDAHEPLPIITYNNAYYEAITEKKYLKRFGLPERITEEMFGAFLGTYTIDDRRLPPEDRWVHLYECSTIKGDAVLIMEDYQGQYCFALFCNYVYDDTNSAVDAAEMCRVFGITSADDIQSIGVCNNQYRTIHVTTDRAVIQGFFKEYHLLPGVGSDTFGAEVFGEKDEMEQQELSRELADEMQMLFVKLENGLTFYIHYYPSIGYIHQNLNYYKLTPGLSELLQESIVR